MVFFSHFALLVKVISVERKANLRTHFTLPTATFFISVLLGFVLGTVLVVLSVTGIHKSPSSETARKHMFRSRVYLWLLAGLCLSKLIIDFYVMSTFADSIKENVEHLPEAAGNYNSNSDSGSIYMKIGLVFNNGTALFIPENSTCIIPPNPGQPAKKPSNIKYYSNERRVLQQSSNSVTEVTDDNNFGVIKYCDTEPYMVINVDLLHDQIDSLLLTVFGISYAVMAAIMAGMCWGVTYCNKKYYTACVEFERNNPAVDDLPPVISIAPEGQRNNIPPPVVYGGNDFEQLDSSTTSH